MISIRLRSFLLLFFYSSAWYNSVHVDAFLGAGPSTFSTQQSRRTLFLKLFAASFDDSSSPSSGSSDDSASSSSNVRRGLLTTSFGAVLIAATAGSSSQFGRSLLGTTDDTSMNSPFLSLDDAMAIIESDCDRRFLHAVVASDYKFMYRGVAASQSPTKLPISIRNDDFDLLTPSTYDDPKAMDLFASLENDAMKDRPIKPSNGHLATTSITMAKLWGGEAVSVWPLMDDRDSGSSDKENGVVHFAWLEKGGEFFPTTTSSNSITAISDLNIIVDGIDCGRMSLEDALEKENSEIMFSSTRFLAVPVSYEKQLIERLKSSFII